MVSPLAAEPPMDAVDDIFSVYARGFEAHREVEMSLGEYLELCRQDPMA